MNFHNEIKKPLSRLTRRWSMYSLHQTENYICEQMSEDARECIAHTPNSFRLFTEESIPKNENSMYERLMNSLLETNGDDELYCDAKKNGNIILDMDGTLGDYIPASFEENPRRHFMHMPIPRPGLRKFFAFVFAHYERVSIWTAASIEWFEFFKLSVLLPNMPQGTSFHFEKTRAMDEPYVALKPLSVIYKKFPDYNSSNTVIVDDNVETFKDNRENALHIPSFCYDNLGGSPETRRKNAAKDRGLFTIMEILQARKRYN